MLKFTPQLGRQANAPTCIDLKARVAQIGLAVNGDTVGVPAGI